MSQPMHTYSEPPPDDKPTLPPPTLTLIDKPTDTANRHQIAELVAWRCTVAPRGAGLRPSLIREADEFRRFVGYRSVRVASCFGTIDEPVYVLADCTAVQTDESLSDLLPAIVHLEDECVYVRPFVMPPAPGAPMPEAVA